MLFGKTLYRDVWYDKPPLVPMVHLIVGARDGSPLRLLDAAYAWLVCWLAWGFARDLWSQREAVCAAVFAAFFLVFDFPAAAIPVASDLLLVAPGLAAVWLVRKHPVWCGVALGVAFWASPKALFVFSVCCLWNLSGIPGILAGFISILAAGAGILALIGAGSAYWTEVWQWGRAYAASPFVASPIGNGLVRSANWLGFHCALAAFAAVALWQSRERRWLWIAWLALAAAGVSAGLRFFPRYYFLLFPPLVLLAARGVTLLGRRSAWLALLLAIPLVRFAPSYWRAAHDLDWRDTAMDRDSREAAALTKPLAHPGDTLFVWGYRPELFVYTGLPAATLYLDSQPLTGVPADRHLTQSEPIDWPQAASARRALTESRPSFILDGLSLFNPSLAIDCYPELRDWFGQYREVARSRETIVYQLRAPSR